MESNIQNDEKYMRMALKEANLALQEGEIPIGAIIVCGDRIVGRGYNITEMLADVTAHAEMQAITAASTTIGGKYLTDCTIYVTIEPCLMCAGALAWSQIGRIVYGARDEKRGFLRFGDIGMLHPKTVVTGGVLEKECRELMQNFFAKKR